MSYFFLIQLLLLTIIQHCPWTIWIESHNESNFDFISNASITYKAQKLYKYFYAVDLKEN